MPKRSRNTEFYEAPRVKRKTTKKGFTGAKTKKKTKYSELLDDVARAAKTLNLVLYENKRSYRPEIIKHG